MRMKATIILASIIVFIGIFYLWGVRFSSQDIIYRKIPFDKVKDIKCGFWKHRGGDGHIGDMIVFDDSTYCKIVNDTLYVDGEAQAIVIKVIQRNVVGDYIITLKQIPEGKECSYIAT